MFGVVTTRVAGFVEVELDAGGRVYAIGEEIEGARVSIREGRALPVNAKHGDVRRFGIVVDGDGTRARTYAQRWCAGCSDWYPAHGVTGYLEWEATHAEHGPVAAQPLSR